MLETAGRTRNMVEEPVMANTVQRRVISRYQAKVLRGGIGFGERNFWSHVCWLLVVAVGLLWLVLPLIHLGEFMHDLPLKRRVLYGILENCRLNAGRKAGEMQPFIDVRASYGPRLKEKMG